VGFHNPFEEFARPFDISYGPVGVGAVFGVLGKSVGEFVVGVIG